MDMNGFNREDNIEYVCPECDRNYDELLQQFWIQCDYCQVWYHGECIGVKSYDADYIGSFFCYKCERHYGKVTEHREPTNSHRHNPFEIDPPKEIECGTKRAIELILNKFFPDALEMINISNGDDINDIKTYFKKYNNKPTLVRDKKYLGLTVPQFDAIQIMHKIGPDFMLDVINSRRQVTYKMKFDEFKDAISKSKDSRRHIFNCISLEISRTGLDSYVESPTIVKKLSWVDNCWPREVPMRPYVAKYCLISMAGSYTDFHVDFGGTSVWYHVVDGSKIFYLIEPTKTALKHYKKWCKSDTQLHEYLPSKMQAEVCWRLEVKSGETLFIPTGWIHAVYTTDDSIVFGGNYLNSFNVGLQLKVYKHEKECQIVDKFLFPYFELTNWYSVSLVCRQIEMVINDLNETECSKIRRDLKSYIKCLENWRKVDSDTCERRNNGDLSYLAPKGLNLDKMLLKIRHLIRKTRLPKSLEE